jgi:hypothetical protein
MKGPLNPAVSLTVLKVADVEICDKPERYVTPGADIAEATSELP